MNPLPIKMKPGVFRNGTRLQAQSRWHSANRVRWHDGSMRPIGGWDTKPKVENGDVTGPADKLVTPGQDPVEVVRDGIAWRNNNAEPITVWGSNYKAVWQKQDGTFEDISPSGFPTGPSDPTVQTGYGSGLYGQGLYGRNPSVVDPVLNYVGRWKFDTWGENLIGLADWDGKLYQWVPVAGNNFEAISGDTFTPDDAIKDFIVTQERFLMTVGGSSAARQQELRRVTWSHRENFTVWEPKPENQAGSYVLPGKGEILGIFNLRNQVFILTETDAWIGRYIGPPYVYGFEQVGQNCQCIHKSTVAVLPNGSAVWAGERNFWIYDGSVHELPCDLIDYLVDDLSIDNVSKSFTWINSAYSELWFHYPSVTDPGYDGADNLTRVEPGRYVMWNWSTGTWSQGQLRRTAGLPAGVYNLPQMVDYEGQAYWHENAGNTYTDNVNPAVRSGPLLKQYGGQNVAIRAVIPDAQIGNWRASPDPVTGEPQSGTITPGPVSFFFEGRQTPYGPVVESPVYVYDPSVHTPSQPIPVRFMASDVMMVVFAPAGDEQAAVWEWGEFRLDIAPVGTGPR